MAPKIAEQIAADVAAASRLQADAEVARLVDEQLDYAAQDVLYLHRLRERLDEMLAREGRTDLASKCFGFLPARAALDLAGWPDQDIFAH